MTAENQTKGVTRRTLVASVGAGALLSMFSLGAARPVMAQTKGPAETIFHGGTVVTVEDAQPTAEAVAVAGGRILAVGTEAEVMKLAGPDTKRVDLAGATLLPGFIDSHGHFMNALQIVNWVNVSGKPVGPVTSIADIVTAVQGFAEARKPAKGEWIIGYGYDSNVLSDKRELTRDDLDPHFPDNPIMLIHVSNHGCVLNSAGFAKVGMDASTPTPPGGLIRRKPGSNEPEGLLMETAFLPLFADMPKPGTEELLELLASAQEVYSSRGVTTAQEGATHKGDLELLLRGAEEGRLVIDVVSLPMVLDIPALVRDFAPDFVGGPMDLPENAGRVFGTYHNRLKLGGVKLFLDGSPQGKTAFWTQPLLTGGPAGETDYVGFPLFPYEAVAKVVAEFVDKGIQTFTHANGDAAIDMVIDAMQAAGVKAGDDRRDVVIHSQFMRPEQLDAYVDLGLSPSFFTGHTFFWGDVHIENTGIERASFISPTGSAQKRGIRFSNHSDFSVTPMDPMLMMQSSILRKTRSGVVLGPDQRIDSLTALKALTIEAAWQYREEATKGSIAPGKLADLVILDRNPLTVDPESLLEIRTLETFKEGVSVWKAQA